MMFRISLSLIAALTACPLSAAAVESVDVRLNDAILTYPMWHKLVMPGSKLSIDLPEGYNAELDGAPIGAKWTAPTAAGNHNLLIFRNGIQLHRVTIFVLEPSKNITSNGYLGNYRIGKYPRNTPRGFIKLEKGEGSLPVSPSFNVGQFLCKQQPKVWPKYLLVSEDNLTRLEVLLKDLNENNITDAKTFFVMSGYRTPFYNTAIGSAKYSRHMYGDAADIYVDTKPRDGVMDDLNGDGQVTKADANFLYDYSKKLFAQEGVISGGLGSYKANAVHGPFVHVDARGRPARWGR